MKIIKKLKGVLKGVVCQNHQRFGNTLGVLVKSSVMPKKFKKYDVRRSRSRVYMVHFEHDKYKDELLDNNFLLNKRVLIAPCAPKSKHKRFMMLEEGI